MEAPQSTLVLRTLNDTDAFRRQLKVWGVGGGFHTHSQSFHTLEQQGGGASPDLPSSSSLVSGQANTNVQVRLT